MSNYEDGLPIEEFIQALTSQLDRAQVTMALKARFGLPLTFAVKEISIDLRAHVEMVKSQVRIRPAGPNEGDTSIIHLALTTITRPTIEENTLQMQPDEPSLKDVLGDEVTEEERRRLEWAGIHSVSQLRELQRQKSEQAIEQIAQIPAMRLRAALERASRPHVSQVVSDGATRLRVRGLNLMQEQHPTVRIDGEPVTVLEASDREILVAPLSYPLSGALEVETAPGQVAQAEFDLTPAPRSSMPSPVEHTLNGGGS